MNRCAHRLLRTPTSSLVMFQRIAQCSSAATNSAVQDRIKGYVEKDDVVLFMKGSPAQPMCGFSKLATRILELQEVKFQSYDVLEDEELREGIKAYSDWPTIPQLYVKHQFVGGSDIMRQMLQDHSLDQLWKDNGIPFVPLSDEY